LPLAILIENIWIFAFKVALYAEKSLL